MRKLFLGLIASLMLVNAANAQAPAPELIFKGDMVQVGAALASGANPNTRYDLPGSKLDKFTPLLFAIAVKQSPIAKLLIDKGADLDAPILGEGITPLHLAINASDVATVEYLIDRGAALNAKDRLGKTPLHYATGLLHPFDHPYTKITDLLLAAGADANIKDSEGKVPSEQVKIMEKEWQDNAAFLAKKAAEAKLVAERKQATSTGKHRYGENAYICTNRLFTNLCSENIEITIKQNQICTGGTFKLMPGQTVNSNVNCRGLATWTAIFTGD
jgi:ankyrin repeat protein